jgi:hypothetical protein
MIFRDLIQPEEFVIGQKAYIHRHNTEYVISKSLVRPHLYPLWLKDDSYTKNGMLYHISDYADNANKLFKDIITNKADRIFPIKYKPL